MNHAESVKSISTWSIVQSLISLTKPTIVFSFTLTGACALVVEGTLLHNPAKFISVLLAILFTAASANGLNQYLEREIDAKMERTRNRRPLPQGKIKPKIALGFSILLGVVATLYLAIDINLLSAALALGTILFYVFVYTLWLKARTYYNIVIGGAAGATAPLIAWAAATGKISLVAGLMFLIIFMWTPPHFWALALCVKDQYAKVGIPMLPVVKGEERTRLEILLYCILLIPLSLLFLAFDSRSYFYSIGAFVLGCVLLMKAWKTFRMKTVQQAYSLFSFSIFYLMALFIMMMIDIKVKN